MQVPKDDNTFYFDECKHKWTEATLLKVLINPDWDIPKESVPPLTMLTEYWGIDTNFPERDPELAEELEVATGTSLPLSTGGDFDSPDKPLTKKRGTGEPQELSQAGHNLEMPS
jgi:hypothetical protein